MTPSADAVTRGETPTTVGQAPTTAGQAPAADDEAPATGGQAPSGEASRAEVMEGAPPPVTTEGEATPEGEANLAKSNTIHRAVDALDIANVVAFLASPKSVAITGDTIAAGGGVGKAIHY